MAADKIIEGTSDEILDRWAELSGHRLKVIVLDELPRENGAPAPDDQWVKELKEWAYNRPPATTELDDSRETLYEDRLK